ncbi:MAG: lipopolysaccharide heptosyltransferase II [Terriglobia bacterium]
MTKHEIRSCNPKKIMVRATNWIGDAVMSLPAIEALHARFPDSEIVLVSKPWVSEIYWNHPAVSRQIVYDAEGEHRGARGFWKLVRKLRSERFDAALLLQNAFHAAWMAWCARIPIRIGYARDGRSSLLSEAVELPPPAAYGHQVYYYLQLLFRCGIIERPKTLQEVRLHLADSEQKWAVKQLQTVGLGGRRFLVGLSPGASFGAAKRWLPDRYANLADRLIDGLGADVLIFGSHAEKPLAEAVARAMEHTPVLVAGKTTLREFMALLAKCHLVITNDSGPMHVAAALGLPLLAIFGSTDERATGPVGLRVRIVKHPVKCSPCGLHQCPIDFRCMTGISVDDVYTAALESVKDWEIA